MSEEPKYEYIVQGDYQQGWEDLTAHETRAAAVAECNVYNTEEPELRHRVVRRLEETIDLAEAELKRETFYVRATAIVGKTVTAYGEKAAIDLALRSIDGWDIDVERPIEHCHIVDVAVCEEEGT